MNGAATEPAVGQAVTLAIGGTGIVKDSGSGSAQVVLDSTGETKLVGWHAMDWEGKSTTPTPPPTAATLGSELTEEEHYEAIEAWLLQEHLASTERIDWHGFFTKDRPPVEYSIPVLVPKGRQTAIYSSVKVGKSLLTLDVVARAATGKSVLGEPARPPIKVLYLDFEMTEEDLFERIQAMGFGPEDEALLADNLFYYPMPMLPPLDTAEGGAALQAKVLEHGVEVLVLDTTSRIISGRENDADTWLQLYRNAGLMLKKANIGLLRLDHSGKDEAKGQRGSSAKGGDLDTVYQLSKRSDGKLLLSHGGVSRVPWMADNVVLDRQTDPLRHVVVKGAAGSAIEAVTTVEQINSKLDELGHSNGLTNAAAKIVLRAAPMSFGNAVLAEALRVRKARSS